MITFKQILVVSIFTFFGLTNQVEAQLIDSLPYFKVDLLFADNSELDILKSYKINLQQGGIKQNSSRLKNFYVITKPVVINHEEQYFKIGVAQGTNCKNCRTFWWDKNGDGLIQPKVELRCGSSTTKVIGKLQVKEARNK